MRLVSLTPSNTEVVYALGLEDGLVGVDDHSDYPTEVVDRLPRLGPDLQIDVDRVAALQPDLVLASLSVPGMERVVEQVAARGLPQIVLNPESLEDVFDDIVTVGRSAGCEDRARNLVDDLRGRLERIGRRGSPHTGTRPLRLWWEWWPKPLITPGRRSWINDLCEIVGARNVFDDLPVTSQPVTDQQVFERDPEAVVMCWCGTLQKVMDAERVRSRLGWSELRAVRDGAIYAMPEELFGRPGPRLVDGAALLAATLRSSEGHDEEAG